MYIYIYVYIRNLIHHVALSLSGCGSPVLQNAKCPAYKAGFLLLLCITFYAFNIEYIFLIFR